MVAGNPIHFTTQAREDLLDISLFPNPSSDYSKDKLGSSPNNKL